MPFANGLPPVASENHRKVSELEPLLAVNFTAFTPLAQTKVSLGALGAVGAKLLPTKALTNLAPPVYMQPLLLAIT